MKNIFTTRKMALFLFTVMFICTQAQVLAPKKFKKELRKQKGVLVDVRTPEEYDAEKIEGAININVGSKFFLDGLDSLDRSKHYFVYCGMGKRSARAIIYMKELDFTHVYDLEGGLTKWKKKGLKTVVKK